MPRRNVLPHARRRALHACETCRQSKRKCDNLLPCFNCIKKGLSASCAPATVGKGNALPSGGSPLISSIQTSSGHKSTPGSNSSPRYPAGEEPSPISEIDVACRAAEQDRSASVEQPHRMLLNSRGERVYIGSAGALSFLQFLRRTLKYCNGPSPFTESLARHTMLEAHLNLNIGNFSDTLDPLSKRDLVEHFLQASSGFVHVFTDAEVSDLLSLEPNTGGAPMSEPDQDRIASLYAMIAIGAQCRGHGPADLHIARLYFSQAHKIASRNMMLEPDLSMVRNFLLLGFFMCCACRRNTAMLYLGIAARTATILGLHVPEPPQSLLPPEYKACRRRIWRSIRVFDLLCNAILGRPSGTDCVQSLSTDPGQDTQNDTDIPTCHGEMALNANYQNCAVIQHISQTLMKRGNHLDQETAQGYLRSLKTWARNLPDALRDSISKQADSQHRRRSIGNIHVSCGYYYSVILVTRPFLVARIVPTLHRNRSSTSGSVRDVAETSPSGEPMSKNSPLPRTCLNAAVYLVQCCQDAASLDLLLGNMCILQPWVFAAGLVLGFSLLDPGACSHPDAESSFVSSQRILQKISRLSPQAQRYLEILTSFSDAVASYNGRYSQPSTRSSSEQVEQILPPVFQGSNVPNMPRSNSLDGEGDGPTESGGMVFPDSFGASESLDLTSNPFGAQITDDIGFQQFWDDYTAGIMPRGPPEASWTKPDSGIDIF